MKSHLFIVLCRSHLRIGSSTRTNTIIVHIHSLIWTSLARVQIEFGVGRILEDARGIATGRAVLAVGEECATGVALDQNRTDRTGTVTERSTQRTIRRTRDTARTVAQGGETGGET